MLALSLSHHADLFCLPLRSVLQHASDSAATAAAAPVRMATNRTVMHAISLSPYLPLSRAVECGLTGVSSLTA